MLSILLTFVVLAISTYYIGRAVILCVYGSDRAKLMFGVDTSIVLGLCLITTYAGYFSIFTKVSMSAAIILMIVTIMSAIYVLKKDKRLFPVLNIRKYKFRYILAVASIIAVALWTNISPQHYDTYLYHAQAIHWIEDYGVVKGLGNLHFRLAYNSTFLPLQALFSFKWLCGQSLHTVNGFIMLFMIVYIFITIFKNGKIMISDVMKVGSLLYVFYISSNISSPNTDVFAMMLVLYIFIKWIELIEKRESCELQYGFLGILTVFAASLKLSAGIVVLFAIYPGYLFVKNKKFRYFWRHIFFGIVIIAPFLIRNIIISGYLIYPYEKTGLTFLKWIMPVSILLGDRAEIIAWGRGNYDISRNSEFIWQWIGDWYMNINILWKFMFVIAVISSFILMFYIVKKRMWKKDVSLMIVIIMGIVGFVFWMKTAPLPRYGVTFMIILISLTIGLIVNCKSISMKSINIGMGFVIASYVSILVGYCLISDISCTSLLLQPDYENRPTTVNEINGYVVYTPVSGDQTGYDPFPSSYAASSQIKLLGNDMGEGFFISYE